ncbi:hypothetical protein R70723_32270 [Paenibacillus sp. FSL R7-0273]|uniref:hypothetical protein n=1 Tax=Paenibacillus sp. FSL R7-0273 TaxID=1536772 RepID=UPI0004F6111B|nr:hypothetical protein [Paenibacillus sp. FSL R7-0273]AIQ50038.1 hypothetical protein R70723_32270 [Paenibacillus sp. FSL R7-0273]OMF90909.1 hypothetical protein BK144_16715 [Paenibacillus sp. FSL R7-0273]
MKYLLDTNAYCLLFNVEKNSSFLNLESKIMDDQVYSFYISEVTSLEIYSVIGKMQRGSQPQEQKCSKVLRMGDQYTTCSHTWYIEGNKKLNKNLFRDITKLLSDIENQRGYIKANVLSYSVASSNKGKQFLRKYSSKYKFGSQDAIIVGNLMQAKEEGLDDLVLVTSDKSLIAALKEEDISYYDPNKNELYLGADARKETTESIVS